MSVSTATDAPAELDAAVAAAEGKARRPRRRDGWTHFVAGNLGGVAGLTVSYPLDTVKVRMQTQRAARTLGSLGTARAMWANEGAAAFYRGLLSPVLGYGVINAVAFGTYGNIRAALARRSGPGDDVTVAEASLAGACAGLAQSFVRSPIERVKTLCQAKKGVYRGTFDCALRTLREEGFRRGLMQGTAATVYREVPQYAMYYPLYEGIKRLLTPEGANPAELAPWRLAVAGGLAGMIQWLPPIYCVDVVKSRIQGGERGKYKGVADCVVRSYREEGARVFVRGLTPALVRAFPLHGTIFCVYEVAMRVMGSDDEQERTKQGEGGGEADDDR